MTKFHSDEYIDFLYRVTPENLDQFNKYQQKCRFFLVFSLVNIGEDCPVFDGLYEFCSLSTGGSISGAAKLNRGEADICVNWGI